MKKFKLFALSGFGVVSSLMLGAAKAEPYLQQSIPGTVRAIHFDLGGQGIGYSDNTVGNSGGMFRPDEDVDIASRGSGTLEVRTEAGESLNYTVNVMEPGQYAVTTVYSLKSGVGAVSFAVGTKELSVNLPTTGGHGTFSSYASPELITIGKGVKTISLKINSNNIYLRSISLELIKRGEEFYISKSGAGSKDGTSLSNAFPIAQVSSVINTVMKPGDTLYVVGGLYESSTPHSIGITAGGDADLPKRIVGLDVGSGLPVFRGKWSSSSPTSTSKSWVFLRIANTSAVEVQDIRVEKYLHGIMLENASNILLNRLAVENVREGIVITGLHDSVIQNSSITKFGKRGIRMSYATVNSQVVDTVLDGNGGDSTFATEGFPFGVSVENPENGEEPNHDVTFLRVTSKNNLHKSSSVSYQNGDGFSIERTAYNMHYIDSVAYNNTDAGWDDKSVGAVYINTRSFENKRNYRLWSDAAVPTVMHNILSAYARRSDGNHAVGLWTQGNVHITNSTFFENQDEDLMLENVGASVGDIVIENSIMTNENVCGAVILKSNLSSVSQVNNLVCSSASAQPVKLLSPSRSLKDSVGKEFDPLDPSIIQGYRGK